MSQKSPSLRFYRRAVLVLRSSQTSGAGSFAVLAPATVFAASTAASADTADPNSELERSISLPELLFSTSRCKRKSLTLGVPGVRR